MDYRMRKRILTLLIACALLLVCSVQCLAEQIAVYTANDNAKVYDAAGNVIGALPADTALTLTGVKGNVCRVEKSGKTAYMLKADLKQAEAATPQTEAQASAKTATAYVAKDGAKVYNANGKAAGSLSLNAQVTVTAVKGDACKISVNGKTGYMKKADLSAEKVSDAADAETASRTAYAGKDGAQVVDKRGEVIATLSLNA